MTATAEKLDTIIRLDIGCGPNKKPGFLGVDAINFTGVDIVCDIRKKALPFDDGSVEEIHASHFLEHLTNLNDKWERVRFFNEMYRVLKKEGKATLIFPHWCSNRYYGDPTHKEPFSEMGFHYLNKDWRMANAPHTDAQHNKHGGYSCHFDATWGYSTNPAMHARNQEWQMFALQWYKEAAQDIIATLVKR